MRKWWNCFWYGHDWKVIKQYAISYKPVFYPGEERAAGEEWVYRCAKCLAHKTEKA